MKLPTLKDCEAALGEPAHAWVSRCMEIASRLVAVGLVKGTAVYGHWTGPLDRRSIFKSNPFGFVRHGWVICRDETTVVDPTRWVFEAATPYIFSGEPDLDICTCGDHLDDHRAGFFKPCIVCGEAADGSDNCPDFEAANDWPYDEGGNKLLAKRLRPPPPCEGKTQLLHLDVGAKLHVMNLMASPGDAVSQAQLSWLAHVPYDFLGPFAPAIYKAIANLGRVALIPLDNLRKAERLSGKKIGEP